MGRLDRNTPVPTEQEYLECPKQMHPENIHNCPFFVVRNVANSFFYHIVLRNGTHFYNSLCLIVLMRDFLVLI